MILAAKTMQAGFVKFPTVLWPQAPRHLPSPPQTTAKVAQAEDQFS